MTWPGKPLPVLGFVILKSHVFEYPHLSQTPALTRYLRDSSTLMAGSGCYCTATTMMEYFTSIPSSQCARIRRSESHTIDGSFFLNILSTWTDSASTRR
nr:hypothetical protein [Candidatus Sigynarchaeota archaeon]